MNQHWQYWKGGISSEQVDQLIEIGNKYPVAHAGMGFDGAGSDKNYRSSQIRWIPQEEKSVVDLLWYFTNIANRNAFNFDVNLIHEIQYTQYHATENGKYDWHIDTFWANPTTYDRKISVVIQLSDPSEYEGGEFQFDPQYPQLPEEAKAKGSVIVFPSFLSHRVTPVTSGTRKSLVTWCEGPKFR
jgi:PKHD-type hydroxylase